MTYDMTRGCLPELYGKLIINLQAFESVVKGGALWRHYDIVQYH